MIGNTECKRTRRAADVNMIYSTGLVKGHVAIQAGRTETHVIWAEAKRNSGGGEIQSLANHLAPTASVRVAMSLQVSTLQSCIETIGNHDTRHTSNYSRLIIEMSRGREKRSEGQLFQRSRLAT